MLNASAQGVLRHLAPAELLIAENIRDNAAATLTAEFVASIKEAGVRKPVLAIDTTDGVAVRDGQRRTLAAIEAGVETIPVYVVPADTATGDVATIARITDQWVTNEHHERLTTRQKVRAVEQLALAGVSPTRIAKQLKAKKGDVDRAITVGKSAGAAAATDSHNLTLEQAAILASWDDDEHVQTELLKSRADGLFDYEARRWENDRAERAALRATVAQLREIGRPILERRRQWHDPEWFALHRLYTGDRKIADRAEGVLGTIEAAKFHAHVEVRGEVSTYWADNGSVEVADEDIDWDLNHDDVDPAAKPEEGLYDPRLLEERTEYQIETMLYVRAEDRAEMGLLTYNEMQEQNRGGSGQNSTGNEGDEVSDARAEQARRERRQVRECNKLGLAAQAVRRQHLTELLARKTLHKSKTTAVAKFIAETTWQWHPLYAQNSAAASAHDITVELLRGTDPMQALENVTADRAQIITLAIALGAHEANLPKDAWRGGHEYVGMYSKARKSYLNFLRDTLDYQLSPIEQVITGDTTADDINID